MLLEKTLESLLDYKEIQPVNHEISPEYSLEGLILRLKLQYFGHLMQRTDSLENTLMLGKIEGGRRKGRQRTCVTSGELDQFPCGETGVGAGLVVLFSTCSAP